MATRILIVDDDQITRKGLTELLKEFGYEALAYGSGEEAITAAKKEGFTLALVDLKMPGMNGIEVLVALKSIDPGLYVVIMTAYATIETAIESMKLGAFDYLRKPFKAEDLNLLIKSILEEDRFKKSLKGFDLKMLEKNAFEQFRKELKKTSGMGLTKDNPSILRQRYDLHDTPLYWITPQKKGKDCVKPNDLDKMSKLIDDFLKKEDGGTIIIHGIEVLMKHNSLDTVVYFLEKAIENINSKDSGLIISVNPEVLDEHAVLELENLFSGNYMQHMSESLSNPKRRAVIRCLGMVGKASFTEILRKIKEKDTPKLSFHIKKLSSYRIINKDKNGMYFLTKRGGNLLSLLNSIEGEGRKESNTFLFYDADTKT